MTKHNSPDKEELLTQIGRLCPWQHTRWCKKDCYHQGIVEYILYELKFRDREIQRLKSVRQQTAKECAEIADDIAIQDPGAMIRRKFKV